MQDPILQPNDQNVVIDQNTQYPFGAVLQFLCPGGHPSPGRKAPEKRLKSRWELSLFVLPATAASGNQKRAVTAVLLVATRKPLNPWLWLKPMPSTT